MNNFMLRYRIEKGWNEPLSFRFPLTEDCDLTVEFAVNSGADFMVKINQNQIKYFNYCFLKNSL